MLAPIVLFAYNRPLHTRNILDSLSNNLEAINSDLIIYCDGAKKEAKADQIEKIEQVRLIAKNENRFKSVSVIEQKSNKGLANSIIDGVTEVVNKYGKLIVLEDDLITSPYFLKFMNDALDIYFEDEKVISIGSCNYFANDEKISSTLFMPVVDCLGWATWQNRWQLFEPDSEKLLREIQENNIAQKFNLYGCFNFTGMLKQQIDGKVNSWAIRWTATSFLHNKLTLYPNPSLTQHIASYDATHASNLNIKPRIATYLIDIKKEKSIVKVSNYKLSLKGYFIYFENRFVFKFLKNIYLLYIWFKHRKQIIRENGLEN
jgi:hypothetical protein